MKSLIEKHISDNLKPQLQKDKDMFQLGQDGNTVPADQITVYMDSAPYISDFEALLDLNYQGYKIVKEVS